MTSVTISKHTVEGKYSNLTKIINDEDDAHGGTGSIEPKWGLILLYGIDVTYEKAIYYKANIS